MGQDSKIEWTHHTFNPWHGCTKVSPGCKNCYAETFSKRVGRAIWGPTAERWLPSAAYWKQLQKWNREASGAGERRRVFCSSMADVFEVRTDEWGYRLMRERFRLFDEIEACPALDFLLVTKRPENVANVVPVTWMRDGFPLNVWVIVTAEDQEHADLRVPKLLNLPVRAVRGVSYEPALGPIDFRHIDADAAGHGFCQVDALTGRQTDMGRPCRDVPKIDWVIVGGESGPGARPFEVQWARSTVEQCRAAGVACFVKQLGDKPKFDNIEGYTRVIRGDGFAFGKKGGDITTWPEDLRVREFPKVRT